MSKSVLATWGFTAQSDSSHTVFPDGCRDLIFCFPYADKPYFFISALFDTVHVAKVEADCTFWGFRFPPGARIDTVNLLASVTAVTFDQDALFDRIDTYVNCASSTQEALEGLSDTSSIKQAATRLGVSTRTLQRRVLRETGRSPAYWFMLSRIRKAGRALAGSVCLADIADLYGFADQAHMSREFKRWFNTSPTALRNHPERLQLLFHKGYDGCETGVHSSIKKPFSSAT